LGHKVSAFTSSANKVEEVKKNGSRWSHC
jgi:hypothetical protein